jgi:hypothetical protein
MSVKAWQETVVIPTYEVSEPEKNPIFLEKRVYQGSSGTVYPHPVIEKVSDTRVDKEWQAVWLENDYLKIMLLPELGGRVKMAYDKIKERHFVYYNEVIKPALVGLTGPWISGGNRVQLAATPSSQHLRSGGFHHRGACRRKYHGLVQRDRAHVPYAGDGGVYIVPRQGLYGDQGEIV